MSYPAAPATWFITGTSRGLGLELTKQLLDRGQSVAATTRSSSDLLAGLSGVDTTRLLAWEIDLRDEAAVTRAVDETRAHFGSLDVVVNNAGYGFLAAVEEVSDAEARAMFDVQIFGVWNVLRAALPILRGQGGGHVINVSSILGLTAFPGWGLYCAAKFALEGLSESLSAEVADLGINVTLVEPGYMRTNFLEPTSLVLPAGNAAGYESIRDMTTAHQAMPGTQLGDPVKAASEIVALAEKGRGPLRQLLGSDSLALAGAKIEAMQADFEAGKDLSRTTDHA